MNTAAELLHDIAEAFTRTNTKHRKLTELENIIAAMLFNHDCLTVDYNGGFEIPEPLTDSLHPDGF